MVEIKRFQDAPDVIEGWAVAALQKSWPSQDNLHVLVQATLTVPAPGDPLLAKVFILALRPGSRQPLYVETQTESITDSAVAACAWDAMAAIRQVVTAEQAADDAAAEQNAPELEADTRPETD
ncbi:hypothetical protein ACFZAM_31255 [Streptomyces sp. NPDC008079]|uniref:hypothetical protein n=1 Tax=Streptomyces sp. NPDC008079 TaxID=3364806 RepID=UPI0036E3C160